MEFQEGDRVCHWNTGKQGIIGRNWDSTTTESGNSLHFVAWSNGSVGYYYDWELEHDD